MEIYDLELVEKKQQYKDIYTFSFSPKTEITFSAGQWIHLGFPSEKKDKTRVRHMSFASAPADQYIEFSMDMASHSWFKDQMSQLEKGDIAKAFKISGEFTVDDDIEEEIIFIIGGIGITPVRSILRDITSRNINMKWKLLHVSRDHFLYEDEFKKFKEEQWRVNRSGVESKWDAVVQNHESRKYYVCGSEQFINGMTERLASHNITADKIVTENFSKQ